MSVYEELYVVSFEATRTGPVSLMPEGLYSTRLVGMVTRDCSVFKMLVLVALCDIRRTPTPLIAVFLPV